MSGNTVFSRSSTAILLLSALFVLSSSACSGGSDDGCTDCDLDVRPDSHLGRTDTPNIPDTGQPLPDLALDTKLPQDVNTDSQPLWRQDVRQGAFGAPCLNNDDCASGWCVSWDEGNVCSQLCTTTESCPDEWECRSVLNTLPDLVFACHPAESHLCRSCASDYECGAGYCLEVGAELRCARPCGPSRPCPTAYECVEVESLETGLSGNQCLPLSGLCDCGPINVGRQRSCSVTNEFGVCWGAEICDAEDGWVGCSARVPEQEDCDGQDNDCDGLADEDLVPPGEACENVVEGVGTCVGVWVCRGDLGWNCSAGIPEPERCDGQDNDCDGLIDEDFIDEATGLYLGLHHCGTCNNDCEGTLPQGTETCEVLPEIGPQCVIDECDPGMFQANEYTCLPIQPLLCQACTVDAACQVPGDLCLEIGAGRFCGRNCAPGSVHGEDCPEGYQCVDVDLGAQVARQCVPVTGSCDCTPEDEGLVRTCSVQNEAGRCFGTQICDAVDGWSDCDALVPSTEVCDGLDNDCDLQVDEGVVPPTEPCESLWDDPVTGEIARCEGEWLCGPREGRVQWLCLVQQAGPELCDGRDNDCDGETDEDFRDPATGRYVNDEHCGACGVSCEGVIPNAVATCALSGTQPACVVAECAPGYYQAGPSFCAAVRDNTCIPCATDENCSVPGDRCLEIDGSSVCARDCGPGNVFGSPEGECDEGFECVADGEGGHHCEPVTGSCSCNEPGEAGRSRACIRANETGTCTGTQVCDPAVGWSECSALVPSPETCNGVDDDCNGAVDEDVFPPANDCAVVNVFGRCEADWVCARRGGVTDWYCDAPTPAGERCDSLDNDCDGATDEDFRHPVTGLYDKNENCGRCGNVCDGDTILFAASTTCSTAGGVARCVVVDCEEGYYQPAGTDTLCVPAGQAADCSPCSEDEHCAGLPGVCVNLDGGGFCARSCPTGGECEEGYDCVLGRCLPESGSCTCLEGNEGSLRACSRHNVFGTCFGEQLCDPLAGWSACSASTPSAELCDGRDNDCDGLVDEGVIPPGGTCTTTNEFGACSGQWYCGPGDEGVAWQCGAPSPEAETCNYRDDDCDGETDEGFRDPVTGRYDTVVHCGVCGYSCVGRFENGTAACDAGRPDPTCVVESCAPGYYRAGDFACLPVSVDNCELCNTDDNCPVPGDRCLDLDGGRFCGSDCSAGNLHGLAEGECQAGYECVDVAGQPGVRQCVPVSGSCTCVVPEHDGRSRLCVSSNGFGTCLGEQICFLSEGAEGWSDCDAPEPADEVCNGIDDDCDGLVDEGVAAPLEPCQQSNEHGVCTGAWSCRGGEGWVCDAAVPQADLCDYRDNDCDGETDEDYRVAGSGSYLDLENCGACGVTCVGRIPNATARCALFGGFPRCEVESCDPGYYQSGAMTCLPVVDTSCTPCATDANCTVPGDRCLTLDGGRFCGRDCGPGNLHGSPAGSCPEGFACLPVAGLPGELQCQPTSGSCTCLAEHEGASRTCLRSNALGTCYGTESCDPLSGWSGCTARVPAAELCNGVDEDCDGLVDEGVFPPSEPCLWANEAGTCTGTWFCGQGAGGVDWYCNAPEPVAETCNFSDDDCDGLVDEDFRDGAGRYVDDAHCGTCNYACEGRFEHATAAICDASGANPTCVVVACEPGYYVSGFGCREVTNDLCQRCDSDEDCPVPGDQCLTLDGDGVCGYDCSAGNAHGSPAGECPSGFTCLAGQCQPLSGSCGCLAEDAGASRTCVRANALGTCYGQETCDPLVGWQACTALVPAAETCNGVDDDCDGLLDEDVVEPLTPCAVSNGLGTCSGQWSCGGAGGWQCDAATPTAETCDYVDNDCDGATDEIFRHPGLGVYVAQDHCGACGVSCTGRIPNATSACALYLGQPRCEVESCDPGYYQAGDLTCLPVTDTTCLPCVDDASCPVPGDLCVPLDGAFFCGRDCSAGNLHGAAEGECPAGFACLPVAGVPGAQQCQPSSGSCTCLDTHDGNVRTCVESNAFGICYGSESCDPALGWGGCTANVPAEDLCDGVDNDCDGQVDEAATPPAAACEQTNGFGTCTGDWSCQGGAGWVCGAGVPSAELCDYADNDCDGQTDESFRDAEGRYVDDEHCGACGVTCDGRIPNATALCNVFQNNPRCEVASCDPGYYPSGPLTCLPVTDTSCTPCATDANCPVPGDLCLELDGGRFCGRDCAVGNLHGSPEGSCPAGYECLPVAGVPDAQQCQPLSGSCSCLDEHAGDSRTCVESNGYGTCYGQESCDPLAGWVGCTAHVPAEELCNGVDDDCNGFVDDVEGIGGPCSVSAELYGGVLHTCEGVLVCGEGQTALQCNAATPAEEICNYLDDDCDGGVDEDFADLYSSCSDGLGQCQRYGFFECRPDGSGTRCTATAAPAGVEICDGFDNDCDGASDEDWPGKGGVCVVGQGICERAGVLVCDSADPSGPVVCSVSAGAAAVEICDGLDNDCDGGIDEDWPTKGSVCTVGQGICERSGVFICDPSAPAGPVVCSVSAGVAGVELCDGLDNDCDGQTDEELVGAACGAPGVCAGARERCQGQAGWQACGPELYTAFSADYEPTEISCDGLDNDCDGGTDESLPQVPCDNQLGACAGTVKLCGGSPVDWQDCTPAYLASVALDYEPTEATCDGLDNDCDGQTDEPFTLGGAFVYDEYCGNCYTDCTAIYAKYNAYGACDSGGAAPVCEMVCCRDGATDPQCTGDPVNPAVVDFYDLNLVPGDGCEFGLDPEAVYVSESDPAALDDATCGLSPSGVAFTGHPCASIAWGIARASVLGRARVLVADGLYEESIDLEEGVDVLGGFRADTWERHLSSTLTVLRGSETGATHQRTVLAENLSAETIVEGFVIYGPVNYTPGGNSYVFYSSNAPGLTARHNVIYGGAGGPGAAGGVGAPGTVGVDGQGRSSLDPGVTDSAYDAFETDGRPCGSGNDRQYTNGGDRTCGATEVGGGDGGGNQCPPADPGEVSASDGAPGAGASPGVGGDAGNDGSINNSSGPTVCTLPGADMAGAPGGNGGDGLAGGGGAGGVAGGVIVTGHWSGAMGASGSAGTSGSGGGGGGAGGGGDADISGYNDRLGGHGGGGGSGGCGGAAGAGGAAGGGSFAFFILSGAAPTLEDNVVFLGRGGEGGRGGNGGAGGVGGEGGLGGYCPGSCWCMKAAGKGGSGGNGGHGGGAGGGAGGAVFGVYTAGVTGSLTFCTSDGNTFVGGSGGTGGAGGLSLANPGDEGADGPVVTCEFN